MQTTPTKRFVIAVASWGLLVATGAFGAAAKPGDHYVTVDQVDERLAPSGRAKSTNILSKGQKVQVFELKNGWARVSQFYGGEVEGASGQVARWVPAESLSVRRPAEDRTPRASGQLGKALEESDDFAKHSAAFVKASQSLIDSGRCKLQDFEEMGGWVKSSNHGGAVYFTYCGRMHRDNRVYLDVASGRIFS